MTKALTLVFLAACAAAWAAGENRPAAPTPATGPAPRSSARDALEDQPLPMIGTEVPLTPPTEVFKKAKRPKRLLPVGAVVRDLAGTPTKSADGNWWTIRHPQIGLLRLLPCERLESVEKIQADKPDQKLSLSGQVYRYRQHYYLILRLATRVEADAAGSRPPAKDAQPTTGPAKQPPSPSDIGAKLLGRPLPKPIPPAVRSADRDQPAPPSGLRVGKTLSYGPAGMVAGRLGRLVKPTKDIWSRLAFLGDNTLQQPPLRVLPNEKLEEIEKLSRYPGTRFHVSGETHYYKGAAYVLIRSAIRQRNMDEF